MKLEDFASYIISLLPVIDYVKIFFILFSLFLVFFIIYLLSRASWLKYIFFQDALEFSTFKAFGFRKITKDWERIIERLRKNDEAEAKLAIIEADTLLDHVLKKIGYKGENLDERLKQLNLDILPNLTEIIEAHQISNNIIHDPDYRLDLDEAGRVLLIYEKAFQNLEVF